jgi:hypothetical protein
VRVLRESSATRRRTSLDPEGRKREESLDAGVAGRFPNGINQGQLYRNNQGLSITNEYLPRSPATYNCTKSVWSANLTLPDYGRVARLLGP